MASENDRVGELEREVARLMHEVDRYRQASEDALQQLDWCIGYFSGSNKHGLAKALGNNRSYIRHHLLQKSEQPVPTGPEAQNSAPERSDSE